MHVRIPRNTLSAALKSAQAAAEKTATTPILGCVLLQTTATGARLTTTNKAITLSLELDATVDEPGEIAVDVGNLSQIVGALPEGMVDLRTGDAGRLLVSAGRSQNKLTAFAAADFPVTPTLDNATTLTMDAADLARVLGQTVFSIAPEDNRYGLNGAKVEKVGELVRFVSTDGNRLSWSEAPFTGDVGIGRKMLIPRGALASIATMAASLSGPVSIRFGERACVFEAPRRTMHIRLLEADFPDYRQVLPTGFKRTVRLDRAELSTALKATAVFAVDGAHSVRFAFTSDALVLSARKLDAGDARNEVACEMRGESITIGLNSRFLAETLAAIRGPEIHLEIGDTLSPVVVKDPAQPTAMFVVMPVRLD